MIKTSKKIHKKHFDKFVESFFSKILEQFGAELNLLANEMYQYPNGLKGKYGKDSENDVFDLIERTYVGLFNNAIIRSFPELATLQEFPVYNEGDAQGRADLLVVKNSAQGTVNLLFEAKCSRLADRDYTRKETLQYYNMMIKQGKEYFKAESDYYRGKTFIVALAFDILGKELTQKFLKEKYKDKITDYYYIYHTNDSGLAISVDVRKAR